MNQIAPNTLDFLDTEIEKRINSFNLRTVEFRKNAFLFVIASATFSATTTVLIALGEFFSSKLFTSLALVSGAILTILAAWDGFFTYKQRWLQTNETLMQLYELRSDLTFQKTIQAPDLDQLKTFYSRYKEIIRQANQEWKELRISQSKTDTASEIQYSE